jgi:hypothetical protein
MAICTKCGTLFHDDDEHECEETEIPKKGEKIAFDGTKKLVSAV